jgi:hypothetical protein
MDNQSKLTKYCLQAKYYYINGISRISICLLIDKSGTVLARGIAICNPGDQFNRKYGRTIALARAFQCLKHKESMYPITTFEKIGTGLLGGYKAKYLPNLTKHEEELLKSKQPKMLV